MPKILEQNKALFRIGAGSATFSDGGIKQTVELSTTLHGTPCVRFEDGTSVYWEWDELLNQALEFKKEKRPSGKTAILSHFVLQQKSGNKTKIFFIPNIPHERRNLHGHHN